MSKRPASPHGFHDATADPDALRDLWARHPGLLVGVPTGPASGLAVLDIDRKHREAIDWWRANRHRLATRTHRTRGGGVHYLFHSVDAALRNSESARVRGVDVRAAGGYLIWWPAAGLPVLLDVPLAPWPAWLTKEVQRVKQRPVSQWRGEPRPGAIAGLTRFVLRAQEGERNRCVFWAACRAGELVRTGKLNSGLAVALLVDAAVSAGLPAGEARATVRSGLRTGGAA